MATGATGAAPPTQGTPASQPGGFTLKLSASPENGGQLAGAGVYSGGSARAVTAVAARGFVFAGWTEGGKPVSSAATYTFTLSGNRTLTALFTPVAAPRASAPLVPTLGAAPPAAHPTTPPGTAAQPSGPAALGSNPPAAKPAPASMPAPTTPANVVQSLQPPARGANPPASVSAPHPAQTPPSPPARGAVQPATVAVVPPPRASPEAPPLRRPRTEIKVVIGNGGAAVQFQKGLQGGEFRYVREVPQDRFIENRERFHERILAPHGDSLIWGLGEVNSYEVADYLRLPLHTVLYAIEPNVAVYSVLPPGYYVAELLPPGVALVSAEPRGPTVMFDQLPPGSAVAFLPSADGRILDECLVVPPPPPVYMIAPAASSPAAPPAAAPLAPPPPNSGASVVYDVNGQVVGVIVPGPDGQQQFVPVR